MTCKDWPNLSAQTEKAKAATEQDVRLSAAIAEKIALKDAVYLTNPKQPFDFDVTLGKDKIHVQGLASLSESPFEQFPNQHSVSLEFDDGEAHVVYEGLVEVTPQKPS